MLKHPTLIVRITFLKCCQFEKKKVLPFSFLTALEVDMIFNYKHTKKKEKRTTILKKEQTKKKK